jgi:hypothetical protein
MSVSEGAEGFGFWVTLIAVVVGAWWGYRWIEAEQLAKIFNEDHLNCPVRFVHAYDMFWYREDVERVAQARAKECGR